MKQYTDKPRGYASHDTKLVYESLTYEALVGSSYDRNARGMRRNLTAWEWYELQTGTNGMPWLYHCQG